MKLHHLFKLSPISLIVLTACGGGGDTEIPTVEEPAVVISPPIQDSPPEDPVVGAPDVEGIELPDIISIVTDNSAPPPATASKTYAAKPYEEAGTDYSNDKTRAYIWDDSMEPLQMVNQILCYVSQTGAEQLVNQTYTALVDTARCERESGGGNETEGQSSGNSDTEYQLWTIESTREDSSSPQRVRIWVPGEDPTSNDPMDQQTILVDVTIASAPSETLPFGDFNMSWKGVIDINGNEMNTMAGTIQTVENLDGKLQFLFYNGSTMPEGEFSFSEAANVILDDADGTSGIGKTAVHRSDSNFEFHSEFSVAYDPERFLRGKDGDNDGGIDAQVCSDRINMEENVWRYNLYNDQDGSRVSLNSGFPFTTNVGGQQLDGYISYWGMWLPDHIDKSEISTITRQNFSNNSTAESYDVVHTPGKLVKRSKSSLELAEMDGATFMYFSDSEYLVEYTTDALLNDGRQAGDAGFFKVARVDFSNGERQLIDITPEYIADDFIHFYSQALGGSVVYDAVVDPSVVTVFKEEIIAGTDSSFGSATSIQLACYQSCVKAGVTTEQLAGIGDSPYYPDSQDPSAPSVIYSYSMSDLTLRDPQGNAIAFAGDQSGQDIWGVQTGVMVLDGSQLANVWDVYNQSVSYVWETGPNDWNKMTYIREQGSSNFVRFDRPKQLLYTHSHENDRNESVSPYAGQSYLLEYGGKGNLWGIPHQQNNMRHTPIFSLNDGTELLDSDGGYVVKAIELEKRMKQLELNSCTQGENALSLDEAINIELPTENDVANVAFGLTDKPVVTDAPRVVGGEIVSD